MKHINILFTFFMILIVSCNGQHQNNTEVKYTNELIHETSPYLLQHAHNPVNWYPWGDKAFQKAKDENKLVIISIGYAACHWCHVMEHESFENVEVAQYMNDHFVCIKVDREERPDVDQIYMDAVQLITGSGGWPLNALVLPNGKPFYAGTYFPKDNWLKMLSYFVDAQAKTPEALVEQSEKVTLGIRSNETIVFSKDEHNTSIHLMDDIFNQWKFDIDFEKGGSKKAPKFPMPSNWEYLLQYHHITKNPEALRAVSSTLDHMAFGGIYDQLGGGFSRYSTDAEWKAPHFEKMLYDNAQLVSLYSKAFQVTQNPLYEKIVAETLDFINLELTDENGGFYASLDADSEGEEGKYYVWNAKEIKTVLGKNASLFMDYYHVSDSGNWEHGNNILLRKPNEALLTQKYRSSLKKIEAKIQKSKEKLLKVRASRIKPNLDDKILTSWNALMIKGYADAYRAFGMNEYKEKAIKNMSFLIQKMIQQDNEIMRNFKNNKATIHGLLDDYAFTISALIAVYQITFDEQYLHKAKAINDYVIDHFFDHESGLFFYTHNDYSDLIARKMEIADNVIPSSNSEMANNLFFLSLYFDNTDYHQKATQMLANVQQRVHENMPYYTNWARLELQMISPPHEVAIVGDFFEDKRKELSKYYLPNTVLLGGKTEGSLSLLKGKLNPKQTTIYVCKNKSCQAPTTEVNTTLKQIQR